MPGSETAPGQERKTIIIAVDNSRLCNKAVDFVKDHFPQGYKFHLLHVQTKQVAPCLGNADAAALSYDMESAIDEERVVNSKTFLKQVFRPQAASGGAEVITTMLHIVGDGSSAVGHAICHFAEEHQAAALAMMKENKSSFTKFFVGSVTRYCAVHSRVPVIIIPE